jgi:hypothetical protein
MTINPDVKKWVDEDYDVKHEDYYVENAFYTAQYEWARSGWKHGLFAFLVGLFHMWAWFAAPEHVLEGFVNIGILTICYWFYGIRNFDANCVTTGGGFYIMMAIFLFITKGKMNTLQQILFAIPSCSLWVYLSIIRPIKFRETKKKMEARWDEMEREEEEAAKKEYEKYKKGYEQFRYGLPESEVVNDSDPKMTEARKLFEGYTDNKDMLKTRYRQLAKQHHPDKGGDAEMFKAVAALYHEYNKKFE